MKTSISQLSTSNFHFLSKKTILIFTVLFFNFLSLSAQDKQKKDNFIQKTLSRSRISGQWFLTYTLNTLDTTSVFRVKRSYFDVKTKINDRLSIRYTQDITIDKEGIDAGNIETRMKYMFLKVKMRDLGFISKQYLEIGMAHRPWVDFDSKINLYRLQDEMFTDRNDIINSADLGVSWVGLFGKELDEDYQKKVSSAYPGRYGSFAIGVFNGGGYSALEKNRNKTIETRITLRPLPDHVPGLQISHAFAYGLANVPDVKAPFLLNIIALSSQSRYHTLHAQYYTGLGSNQDHFVSEDGNSYKNYGFSVLGELKTPKLPFTIFSRYDYLSSEAWENKAETVLSAGVAYLFAKSKLAAYYERNTYVDKVENIFELVLEIKF